MRLIVLAAGKGTRLGEFTKSCNKCMLPIAGKPLLYHNLLQCQQANPHFSEILIVVGYQKEQIQSYFGSDFMGIPIRYVYQYKLDGIAGAVSIASAFLAGEPFMLTLGDMFLIKPRLKEMIERFNSSNLDGLCGVVLNKPLDEMKDNYTLRFDACGRINKVVDKPTLPFNNYMGTGYFIFAPSALKYVDKTPLTNTNQQRGVCDWMMLCIDAGLDFFSEVVGADAVNINNEAQLLYLQNKYSRGVYE